MVVMMAIGMVKQHFRTFAELSTPRQSTSAAPGTVIQSHQTNNRTRLEHVAPNNKGKVPTIGLSHFQKQI
jgi:hypothetical protein